MEGIWLYRVTTTVNHVDQHIVVAIDVVLNVDTLCTNWIPLYLRLKVCPETLVQEGALAADCLTELCGQDVKAGHRYPVVGC